MGYTMAEKILMKNTGLSHLAPGDLIMTAGYVHGT